MTSSRDSAGAPGAIAAPAPATDEGGYWPIAAVLACCAVAFVTWRAWVTDDAFITFRHVANVHAGYGPVFNVGERVQGYSHPLWFLLLLAGSYVLDIYALSVAYGLALSLAMFVALGWFVRRSPASIAGLAAGFLFLFSSRTVVEYLTSGLETSLTAMLVALLFGWVASRDLEGRPLPVAPAIWLSALLVLNRPDHVVLCLPVAAGLLIATRLRQPSDEDARRSRRGLRRSIVGAALLLFAWHGFSTVYYGTPMPNTAYAKTSAAPLVLLGKGAAYARVYATEEPLHVIVAVAVLTWATWHAVRRIRRRGEGWAGLGLVLAVCGHLLYVLAIGGDFMRGRFYLPALVGTGVLAVQLVGRHWSPDVFSGRVFGVLGLVTIAGCGLRVRPFETMLSLAQRLAGTDPGDVLVGGTVLLALLACLLAFAAAWSFRRGRSRNVRLTLVIAVSALLAAGVLARYPFSLSVAVVLIALALACGVVWQPVSPGRAGMATVLMGAVSGAAVGSVCDFTNRMDGAPIISGVTDEWAWYSRDRFVNPFVRPPDPTPLYPGLTVYCRDYAEKYGEITVCRWAIGVFGYYAGPKVRVLDLHGLVDPVVARSHVLPGSRVGHGEFEVPRGYLESKGAINLLPDWMGRVVRQDPTLIRDARAMQTQAGWEDAETRERVAAIGEVVSGEIFSRSRWSRMWSFIFPDRPAPGRYPVWTDPAMTRRGEQFRHDGLNVLKPGETRGGLLEMTPANSYRCDQRPRAPTVDRSRAGGEGSGGSTSG